MRRLLNTLFVTSEDAYLALDGENVVVRRDREELGRFPLHNLEGILCFSYAGASPALMGACVKRSIALSFCTPGGRFLARRLGSPMAMCCCAGSSIAWRIIWLPAAGLRNI